MRGIIWMTGIVQIPNAGNVLSGNLYKLYGAVALGGLYIVLH